jgi:hypothetical protein
VVLLMKVYELVRLEMKFGGFVNGRERLKMKFKCRFVVWVSENDEDEDEQERLWVPKAILAW